ncbi:CoA transferase [Aldersonia sp. NBC_00410]|uniref:CoA transferase n=1 Tax=Aldersonia sp. NBC_00410 TaxID=2975954 RepID=UPI002259DA20|nr:CoA transferase [Aldersonia sp. NBC_00410]MCX5046623.1 CoA transferase [Aldersonia sp. NBC_00410]
MLAATLPVAALALGAVSVFATAADRYRAAIGLPAQRNRLRLDRVAASFAADRMMRIDGAPISGFAELSGFFPTSDGWIRTHANYPHHRTRLLEVLDLPPHADRDLAARRIETMRAADLEDAAAAAGAIAVRVRDETEWAASEPGRAAAQAPIVDVQDRDDRAVTGPGDASATVDKPLAGMRVLDLTRVIAGPTASRALALLGAEVLRIDSPALPEIEWQHLENGQGKASALLDVVTDSPAARGLAARADVLVTGYRPGALGGFGDLAPTVAPGIVRARLSAWGESGPWSGRRGFDSIVQAASGIAFVEGAVMEGAPQPGALPAQALDHATGYLLAAGVLDALTRRRTDERGHDVRVSLARTAAWLLAAPGRDPYHPAPTLPGEDTLVTNGRIRAPRPALAEYDDYPEPAHPWGSDVPAWLNT